jgi:hypothetical protein
MFVLQDVAAHRRKVSKKVPPNCHQNLRRARTLIEMWPGCGWIQILTEVRGGWLSQTAPIPSHESEPAWLSSESGFSYSLSGSQVTERLMPNMQAAFDR